MKSVLLEGRQKMNRATSILFIVQLFGALGAGFFFVVQNVLGVEHILGALEPANEPILWFILFWATDFFFVVFTVIFCYLFAGLPAVAPAFALSIYFAHFAGPEQVGAADAYIEYFATPFQNGGGVNIGYMGYFVMAVVLSLLIKYLYIAWDWIKESGGPKLDGMMAGLRKKIKAIPEEMNGIALLEALDLIVLILILPVASAAITFLVIRYGLQLPFSALGETLQSALTGLSGTSLVLSGVVMGLMVGFDLIGPVSMAAYGAAAAAFMEGDAQLITIYGACFTTIGWIPLFAVLLNKITKKGVKTDTDDMNMALSGPINAFFENMKLTVAFSMPYAYRSPLTVIPGLMAGGACTGLLVSLFQIVNTDYLSAAPIYVDGYTYAELFERGERYISFTLPLRSGDWLTCRIPLFFIVLFGAAVGGLVIYLLKLAAYKSQTKRGTYVEPGGDIVLDMRRLAQQYAGNKKAETTSSDTEKTDAPAELPVQK